MEKSYFNGTGYYQDIVSKLERLTPNIGYTSSKWLNVFICLGKLYHDYYNNGGGNIEDCYLRDVELYIRPLFPAFNVTPFIDGPEEAVERQMDIVLNVLGRVSDNEFQTELFSLWFNDQDKLLSFDPVSKADGLPEWHKVTFGSQKHQLDWCKQRLSWGYWLYDPHSSPSLPGVPFVLGDCRAVFRETDHGLTLFLSRDGTEVPAMHLRAEERRLGEAHWTDVSAGIVQATSKPEKFRSYHLLTPDDLPVVYMREDGKLYCRKCHCTVPNTANNEMRREGVYSHSHVCGFRAEGEVYDD